MNPKLTAPTSPIITLKRKRGQAQQRLMFDELSIEERAETQSEHARLNEKITALELEAKESKV